MDIIELREIPRNKKLLQQLIGEQRAKRYKKRIMTVASTVLVFALSCGGFVVTRPVNPQPAQANQNMLYIPMIEVSNDT
jgi:hypothetical protein